MKQEDEYNWPGYHQEYANQLKQMAAEGQEFFIKNPEFDHYDMPIYNNNIHRNWKEIYDCAVKLKPTSIHECGCGAGYHLKNLHTLLPDAEISGSDLLPDQVEFAKRFSDLPYSITQRMTVVDMTMPLINAAQYEFVFCHAVIMHLSTEHAKAFLLNMEKLSSKYIFLVEGEKNHEDWYEFVQKTLPNWLMVRQNGHIPNGILLIRAETIVYNKPEENVPRLHTNAESAFKSYLVCYQQNGKDQKNAIDVMILPSITAKEKYKAIKEELFKIIGTNENINITGVYLL